ncbi:type II toxin-antitoxin system death-on-curing family toxin [Citrobacter braakii]|uniref:type II toxin-antitoxin system death-on-curing family toxin n=1 Tax=Citrobacter TaxID=544 RepID=UPI0028BE3F9B|nr:type II toxin-antitoxin system death-on-curing family toxin [Citrobacter braakii]MDT7128818.1 type II toxin-antitoxin system death-on-curing family toxin [Citrobacter braakii]
MITFLSAERVIQIHDYQLAEHGGLPGYRDFGAISSIVARVENTHLYNGVEDLFSLASNYLIAISRGHGFNDANKRTALLSALVFLELNNITVQTPVSFADFVAEVAQGIHETEVVAEALKHLAR